MPKSQSKECPKRKTISNYIKNINNYYLLLTNHAQFDCDAM